MKKQNGITLIALIITIIVMLILVGVTVNVALNGGLFTIAKTAAKDTQYEADREVLQAAVIGALDSNSLTIPDAQTLENNLPEGWTVTGTEGGLYIATSPNENEFIIYENGKIKEQSTGDLGVLEKYFIGKNFLDLNPNIGYGDEFIDDPETEIDESTSIMFLNFAGDEYVYVRYNDKAYKIKINESLICNEVELVYAPQGREGETIAYDSDGDGTDEEWMIIYDNGDNVEMVSMSNMGSLALGYTDTEAQTPGDIDKDGNENTNLDKAIYSYNNAITKLNSYCESLVTKEDVNRISVRSIGSNPSNQSSENTTLYTSEKLANWAGGKYNGLGKSGDLNLEQDLVRMSYYGITATGENYWMASRCVDDYSDSVDFGVCHVDSDGGYNGGCLWWVYSSSDPGCNNYSDGVRPVIKISSESV